MRKVEREALQTPNDTSAPIPTAEIVSIIHGLLCRNNGGVWRTSRTVWCLISPTPGHFAYENIPNCRYIYYVYMYIWAKAVARVRYRLIEGAACVCCVIKISIWEFEFWYASIRNNFEIHSEIYLTLFMKFQGMMYNYKKIIQEIISCYFIYKNNSLKFHFIY